ncbi:Manganese/iron superoxide dismutase [Xylariaceae sp. FL0804]|nr:Manganese/iron superoxide dismutase [Xylariaceae sp. FL0804]
MLRPRLRIPHVRGLLRQQRASAAIRGLHHMPPLSQFTKAREEGVPELLSPNAFELAWTQYQSFIIQKLNEMTAGTEYENQKVKLIVTEIAREPGLAALFNYASMAHNNQMFFEGLANLEGEEVRAMRAQAEKEKRVGGDLEGFGVPVPPRLRSLIDKDFGSLETLMREFTAVAMGMFGPGFVWLVKNERSNDLRILPTYLAGSPYTAAHWRRQPVDFATSGGSRDIVGEYTQRSRVGGGLDSGKFTASPGGLNVVPLLCLNTWEHVWLRDYGIVGQDGNSGKRTFVENWWYCINWQQVAHNAFEGEPSSGKLKM